MTRPAARTPITGRDVVWWTSTSFTALGLFTFPRDMIASAGFGWPFALALQLGVAAFSAWLILRQQERFRGMTPIEAAMRTMGRAGQAFEMIMAGIMLVTLTYAYASFGSLFHETTLQLTPQWAITGAMALFVWYASSTGIRAVTRMLQIMTPLMVALGVSIFSFAIWGVRPTFLMPHWTGLGSIVAGAYRGIFVLAGLQNLFIYSAYSDQWPIGRHVMLALLLNAGVLLLVLVTTLGNFGLDALTWITWPGAFLAKSIEVRGFYVERIGFLVILAWVGWVALFLVNTTLTAAMATAQIFGKSAEDFRRVVPLLTLAPYALSLVIPDQNTTEWVAKAIIAPGTLVMLILKPLLLLLAAKLRGIGRQGVPPGVSPPVKLIPKQD
ncbi:MAG: GerAB/ArcD/ProY family transporter [Firmicutes bacterium]|nr:GerAB/ArcD/ProY family transporter [Bacillota bacterium]